MKTLPVQSRLRSVILSLVVVAFLVPVGLFLYREWQTGRICGAQFAPGSERNDVCQISGADRRQVCFNLQNVPFMCSEDFLLGHPDLLQEREMGLAQERARCAADHGGDCLPAQWNSWCRDQYGAHQVLTDLGALGREYDKRHARCIVAGLQAKRPL